MRKYEMLYILSTKLSDEDRDAVISKFESVVASNGGKVEAVDKWGVKKLAYPINYKSEGYYVLYQFECTADVANNVVSLMRIDESVLRQMCIRK